VTLSSRPQSGYGGLANFRDADERNISQRAREQIVIAFAGAAALRMFYPDQPTAEILSRRMNDFEYIKSIVNNPQYGIVEAYLKEAEGDAESLVTELRLVIAVIANALFDKKSLTSAEVKQIYDARRGENL